MSFDPEAYSLLIRRQTIDDETYFVGEVVELPDVRVFEATADEARTLLIDAITTLHNLARDSGRPFPQPKVVDDVFSGRVTLRLPKSLHRDIALLSEQEAVSLNQLIITILSKEIGATSRNEIKRDSPQEQMTATSSGAAQSFPNFYNMREAGG